MLSGGIKTFQNAGRGHTPPQHVTRASSFCSAVIPPDGGGQVGMVIINGCAIPTLISCRAYLPDGNFLSVGNSAQDFVSPHLFSKVSNKPICHRANGPDHLTTFPFSASVTHAPNLHEETMQCPFQRSVENFNPIRGENFK